MTTYAGETVVFTTSATAADGETPITENDVTSTEIRIFDAEGTEVLASTPMVYDTAAVEWSYGWTLPAAGKYTAKMRLIGVALDTWEYQKVSAKEDPYP